jgi:hypothetical protein
VGKLRFELEVELGEPTRRGSQDRNDRLSWWLAPVLWDTFAHNTVPGY